MTCMLSVLLNVSNLSKEEKDEYIKTKREDRPNDVYAEEYGSELYRYENIETDEINLRISIKTARNIRTIKHCASILYSIKL